MSKHSIRVKLSTHEQHRLNELVSKVCDRRGKATTQEQVIKALVLNATSKNMAENYALALSQIID